MKCEVLKDCVISVLKGSVVEVSPRQFELARRVLKPITEKVEEKPAIVDEQAEAPKKRTRKKKEEE